MHECVGHMGVPQTLSHIRSEFWVLQGRRAVQKVIKRCNNCRRVEGRCFPLPPHPPLPDFRTQQDHAFSSVGLDFMGPFRILDRAKAVKVYVLLLTCASTRAVHLEATRSLAVNDFMMAMDRFFSYKGVPYHVESDNAATFVRCNREIKSTFRKEQMGLYFEQRRINWNFYTSRSPHMGGFIERLNQIFKRICRKTFGKARLDFEEFRTMMAYAEAVMNDRPLTYVYSDNNSEGRSLSPSLLTLGYSLLEPPHLRMSHKKDLVAKKYGEQFVLLEQMKNVFWVRWNKEYLTGLFEKHVKANKPKPGFPVPKIDDICLLKNENLPRRRWALCRVLGFKPPKRDGYIRECFVQRLTKKGKVKILKRSPQFLVPLEIEPHYIDDDPLVKVFANADKTLSSDSTHSESSLDLSNLPAAQPQEVSFSDEVDLPGTLTVPDLPSTPASGSVASEASDVEETDIAIMPSAVADPHTCTSMVKRAGLTDAVSGLRRSKRFMNIEKKAAASSVVGLINPVLHDTLSSVLKSATPVRKSKRLQSGVLSKISLGTDGKVKKSKRLVVNSGMKGYGKDVAVLRRSARHSLGRPSLVASSVEKVKGKSRRGVKSTKNNKTEVFSRFLRPRSKTLGLVVNRV